jgi:hypothetical protein
MPFVLLKKSARLFYVRTFSGDLTIETDQTHDLSIAAG